MISIINGIEQMSMKDIVQKYSFPGKNKQFSSGKEKKRSQKY